jgi:predicted HTH domain antitoxin
MTTEEMIKENEPVAMELEYVDELDKGLFDAEPAIHEEEAEETRSKKEQIISLFKSGTTDIARIVRLVSARPSYVAQVLQNEGLISGYFDLYTTTAREQNIYSRFFRNVLSFKTVEAASESVRRIDRLYNYFERLGDRAGQHQAMVLALTGKNRARWSGKKEEAEVFSEWLAAH